MVGLKGETEERKISSMMNLVSGGSNEDGDEDKQPARDSGGSMLD